MRHSEGLCRGNQGVGCHGGHEGRHIGEGDKVTKVAAELIFQVDAHTSLMHSGGKPYECDQSKYFSKTAQNLKTHKLTHSGEKPCTCDQCKYFSKTAQNLKTHKLAHSGEKPYACDQYKYSSALAQALKKTQAHAWWRKAMSQ